MCARIFAVGAFRKVFVEHLGYPATHYEGTREGAVITEDLFGILEGSSLSRDFARLLGISDPWDFNQHRLDPRRFDQAGLLEFGKIYETYQKDIRTLMTLADHGFEFHFRPEG